MSCCPPDAAKYLLISAEKNRSKMHPSSAGKSFLALSFFCTLLVLINGETEGSKEWFKIEGRVQAPDTWARSYPEWKTQTSILVDGGEHKAFLRYYVCFLKLHNINLKCP